MNLTRIASFLIFLFAALPVMAGSIETLPGIDLEPVSQSEILPLVAVCETCHGTGGQSTRADVPVIAGKPADEILGELEKFYYYERHCPRVEYQNKKGDTVEQSMCDITNALTRPEAQALGSYFENMAPAGENPGN